MLQNKDLKYSKNWWQDKSDSGLRLEDTKKINFKWVSNMKVLNDFTIECYAENNIQLKYTNTIGSKYSYYYYYLCAQLHPWIHERNRRPVHLVISKRLYNFKYINKDKKKRKMQVTKSKYFIYSKTRKIKDCIKCILGLLSNRVLKEAVCKWSTMDTRWYDKYLFLYKPRKLWEFWNVIRYIIIFVIIVIDGVYVAKLITTLNYITT